MHIHYVSKLFYCKYAYKVVLTTHTTGNRWWKDKVPDQFEKLDSWCVKHAHGSHKVQRRYQGHTHQDHHWHQIVYLSSADHVHALLKDHVQDVLEVWKPLDQSHLESLEVKNIVEIRTKLLYQKYRYAVYFKYDKTRKIYDWLKTNLADSTTSKLSGSHWWPKVYSMDDLDVTMIRLSYPDAIDYIKTVRLVTD